MEKLKIESQKELEKKELNALQEWGCMLAIIAFVVFFFLLWMGIVVISDKLVSWIGIT